MLYIGRGIHAEIMKHQVCVGRDGQPLRPALGRGLSAAGSGPSGASAGESEEAAERCDEGVFLRIGYSKIATGAPISTRNFAI